MISDPFRSGRYVRPFHLGRHVAVHVPAVQPIFGRRRDGPAASQQRDEGRDMSADIAALEFANDAFYQAFSAASLDAMEAVWAEQPNVFCIHPGWPPITNRAEVMASWKEILSNAGPIPV